MHDCDNYHRIVFQTVVDTERESAYQGAPRPTPN